MMILLTGGAANGKSAFAESLCMRTQGPRFYLASMRPYGAEGEAKINRHRALRASYAYSSGENRIHIVV